MPLTCFHCGEQNSLGLASPGDKSGNPSQASRNNACRQRARAWECVGQSNFAFTVQLSNLHISRALYCFLKGPFIFCWLKTRQKSLNIPVSDAPTDVPGLDPGLRTGLADFSVPPSLSAHALAGQLAGAEGGADEKGPWECHRDMGFPDGDSSLEGRGWDVLTTRSECGDHMSLTPLPRCFPSCHSPKGETHFRVV